jgi:hypothetical protein
MITPQISPSGIIGASGSSCLSVCMYAILHRLSTAYSDGLYLNLNKDEGIALSHGYSTVMTQLLVIIFQGSGQR